MVALQQLVADHTQQSFAYYAKRDGVPVRLIAYPRVELPGDWPDLKIFDDISSDYINNISGGFNWESEIIEVVRNFEINIAAQIIEVYRFKVCEHDANAKILNGLYQINYDHDS